MRLDPPEDRLGGFEGGTGVVPGEQERELVPAEAEGFSVASELRRDLSQHKVAHGVAPAVVHALEVVDVEEAERERRALSLGPLDLATQPLVEVTVVAEAGQWIGQRKPERV